VSAGVEGAAESDRLFLNSSIRVRIVATLSRCDWSKVARRVYTALLRLSVSDAGPLPAPAEVEGPALPVEEVETGGTIRPDSDDRLEPGAGMRVGIPRPREFEAVEVVEVAAGAAGSGMEEGGLDGGAGPASVESDERFKSPNATLFGTCTISSTRMTSNGGSERFRLMRMMVCDI